MQDAFREMGRGAVLEEGAPPANKPSPAGGFGKAEPLRDRGNGLAAGLFSVKPSAARAACVDISDRPSLCMDVRDGFAVVGSSDHALYEVDLKKKRVCRKLYSKQYGHGEWVSAVAYLGDGRVISAGLDSKLCLWSAQGVRCADMRGHVGSISAVAVDSGSRIALSAGYDKTIRCWDVQRVPKEMWAIKGHRSPVMELRWGENGLVASGDRAGWWSPRTSPGAMPGRRSRRTRGTARACGGRGALRRCSSRAARTGACTSGTSAAGARVSTCPSTRTRTARGPSATYWSTGTPS